MLISRSHIRKVGHVDTGYESWRYAWFVVISYGLIGRVRICDVTKLRI